MEVSAPALQTVAWREQASSPQASPERAQEADEKVRQSSELAEREPLVERESLEEVVQVKESVEPRVSPFFRTAQVATAKQPSKERAERERELAAAARQVIANFSQGEIAQAPASSSR
jgi:hypothetical protein